MFDSYNSFIISLFYIAFILFRTASFLQYKLRVFKPLSTCVCVAGDALKFRSDL